MKKLFLMAAICGMAALANAAEWGAGLPKALAQAKTENKQVLMIFHGSDWCPTCKELNKGVMTTPEFEAYAAKHLVLVDVDFPHEKPQSDALKASNKALAGTYAVHGFPTVLVADADGKVLTKVLGYQGEKPQDYIAKLEKVKASGK